ncbi:hypothetical protein [Halorussus caseinilyticus]|uniref:Uncharacterized protein n=1 Tax=Halorussus caseinilyticus TaxID=3034025 RepID=A0ABD5WHF8_9EURY
MAYERRAQPREVSRERSDRWLAGTRFRRRTRERSDREVGEV